MPGRQDAPGGGLELDRGQGIDGLGERGGDAPQRRHDGRALIGVRPRHREVHAHDRPPDQVVEPGPGPGHRAGVGAADDVLPPQGEVAEGAQDRRAVVGREGEVGGEDGRPDGVQAELEPGDDPEVAPAFTEPPEQVGLAGLAGHGHRAVGQHHLGGEQVVAGQPEPPGQVAVPAAEGQPADARVGHHPAGGGQPEPLGLGVQVAQERAPVHRGHTSLGVHRDGAHLGQVDDDAAVGGGVARDAVTAAAHRHLEPGLAGEGDGRDHVLPAAAPGDDRRTPVHHRVPDAARVAIPGVVGTQDPPSEPTPERAQGTWIDDRHVGRNLPLAPSPVNGCGARRDRPPVAHGNMGR